MSGVQLAAAQEELQVTRAREQEAREAGEFENDGDAG